MIWRNIQRLARGIAGQGVQDPGPVDLAGPVQAVQLLDDASRLVAPPDVPEGLVFFQVTGPGGVNIGVGVIEPSAAGLWVRRIHFGDTAGDFWMWSQETLANFTPTGVVTPPWFPPFASRFRIGSFPLANLPVDTSPIGNSGAVQPARAALELDMFLPPGRFLFFGTETIASIMEISIQVREVPA